MKNFGMQKQTFCLYYNMIKVKIINVVLSYNLIKRKQTLFYYQTIHDFKYNNGQRISYLVIQI